MRAVIWLDEGSGRWGYDVRSEGLRCTGDRTTAADAVAEALAEISAQSAMQAAARA